MNTSKPLKQNFYAKKYKKKKKTFEDIGYATAVSDGLCKGAGLCWFYFFIFGLE